MRPLLPLFLLSATLGACTYPAVVYAPPPALTPLVERAGDVRVSAGWSPVGIDEDDRDRAGAPHRLAERPTGNWYGEAVASPAPSFAVFALGSHSDTYEHRHTSYDLGFGTYRAFADGDVLTEAYAGWGRGRSSGIGRDDGRVTGILGYESRPYRVDGTYSRLFGQANLGAVLRTGAVLGFGLRLSRVDYDGTYTGTRDPEGVATDPGHLFLEPTVFVRYDGGLPVAVQASWGWTEPLDRPAVPEAVARTATVFAGLSLRLDRLWRGPGS